MKFDIITIFPKSFSYLNESIIKRAQKNGLIEIKIHNLRNFSRDKHQKIDDRPYGGGPGMVIKIEPMIKAIQSFVSPVKGKYSGQKSKTKIILFTPSGKQFNNKIAADFAKKYQNLILICGHYEGIDARLKKVVSDLGFQISDLSTGPYVLSGGELPAMILIDAVARHLPNVLGRIESLEEKRLGVGVPAYTRPEIFICNGKKYRLPKILISGDHQKIEKWRNQHRKLPE